MVLIIITLSQISQIWVCEDGVEVGMESKVPLTYELASEDWKYCV